MKSEISKTKFATHYVDIENSVLEQIWTNHEGLMSVEDYKADYSIQKALINTMDFGFTITPQLQK